MSGSYMYQFQVGTMKRLCINLESLSLSSTDIALRRLQIPDHTARRYAQASFSLGPLSDCGEVPTAVTHDTLAKVRNKLVC